MPDLDRLCTCGHPIRAHNKPTLNRALVTCSECTDLCLIHLEYQPPEVVRALARAAA